MDRLDIYYQGSSKAGYGDLDNESRSYIKLFLSVWALVGRDAVLCHTMVTIFGSGLGRRLRMMELSGQ